MAHAMVIIELLSEIYAAQQMHCAFLRLHSAGVEQLLPLFSSHRLMSPRERSNAKHVTVIFGQLTRQSCGIRWVATALRASANMMRRWLFVDL